MASGEEIQAALRDFVSKWTDHSGGRPHLRCYGWPRAIAQDGPEIVRRLTELNRSIIEGRPYAPFAD